MSDIYAVAHLQIKDGKHEGFMSVAKEIVASVTKNEPGTTVYDWFVNEETGAVRVIEVYASSEALIAHVGGDAATLFPSLFENGDLVSVDIYGELSDAAKEATAPFGATYYGAPAITQG